LLIFESGRKIAWVEGFVPRKFGESSKHVLYEVTIEKV
jgi:hypothetical protein